MNIGFICQCLAAVMEAHAQEDNAEQIWESRSTSQVFPLGRVMNTVLSAKPKELEAVLSQQTQKLQKNSKGREARILI